MPLIMTACYKWVACRIMRPPASGRQDGRRVPSARLRPADNCAPTDKAVCSQGHPKRIPLRVRCPHPWVIGKANTRGSAMSDFAKTYGPWAVIAGGSEGIGSALAERLAKQGLKLLLIARKPGPLAAVAADIRKRFGGEVVTLSLDLTSADCVPKIAEATKDREVGLLIYNAGADTGFKYFIDRPIEESERMVMLNVMTPMRLARHFAPAMTERGRGGIIMCSSISGCGGSPGNGVYSAVKAFVNTFTEMLWYEVGKSGVDVLGAVLGLTRTPAME